MKKAVLTKLTANYFMVSGKSGKCSVIFLKIVGRGGGREGGTECKAINFECNAKASNKKM